MPALGRRGRRGPLVLAVLSLVTALTVVGSPLDAAVAADRLDAARYQRERAEAARAEAEAEQEAAERHREKTAARQEDTRQRRRQLAQDRAAAVVRLDELEAAFSLAVDEYNATVEELGRLDAQIDARRQAIVELEESAATRRHRMRELVRSLYQQGGALPGYEPLLGLEQPPEAVRWLGLVRDAQSGQLAAIDRDLADRDVLADERQQLSRAQAVRRDVAEDLEQQRGELDERVTAQADELDELRATVADADERLTALEVAAGEAEARVEDADDAVRSTREELEDRRAVEAAEAERVEREQAQREQAQREQAQREQAQRERQAAQDHAEREQQGEQEPEAAEAPATEPEDTAASGQPAASSSPDSASSTAADAAVQAALSQRGVAYVWGGSTPQGFDCSGLTSWAYAQADVTIPRTSREQHARLPRVSREDLRPGDLVFFNSPVSHVGMYIGEGQMVEAPYTGQVVRVRPVDRGGYAGARRPTG